MENKQHKQVVIHRKNEAKKKSFLRKNVISTYSGRVAQRWDAKKQLLSITGDHNYIENVLHSNLKKLEHNSTIVELGCGTGRVLSHCANQLPDATIVGLDISPDMVRSAKQELMEKATVNQNTMVIASEVEELPLPGNFADLGIAKMVLHHLVDPLTALKSIHRVLKQNGKFIAMVPSAGYQDGIFKWEKHQSDPLGRFSANEIKSLVKKSGLALNNMTESNFEMRFNNIGDYFQFMYSVGALSKIFNYEPHTTSNILKFLMSFGNVLQSTGPVVVHGQYLTIECSKK